MFLQQVNPVAIEFGPFSIRWYAILIVSGIILGIYLSMLEAKKVGIKPDYIVDFMLYALPISILGARIYYVIFELPYYMDHPGEIFAIWNGGIAIYGALIAGGLTLYFFCRYHFINMWKFLDVIAPSVILAQGIGRWGNFMNHEAFGPKTTEAFLQKLHLPNFIIENMYIEGAYRTPTFLYESVWNVLGFLLLLLLRRQKFIKQGEVFFSYIIWYSLGRFYIEGLRTDSLYLMGNIRVSQALSIVLFFGAIALLIYRRKKYPTLPLYNQETSQKAEDSK